MIYGDAVAMDGGEILLTKAIDGGEVGMLSSMDGGEIGSFTPVIQAGDYELLDNKPSINGVTLEGDLSTEDLHIQAGVTSWNGQTGDVVYTPPEVPVQSVNGQTGAVVLDADDVGALPDDTTYVGSVSVTPNLSSGTKVGSISVDGTSTDLYAPTNTDTKVTQTATTTTDYTYWRGLCVGNSAVQSESGAFSTVTDIVRTFNNIRVQPSTGTIKATTFKGDLAGTASGNLTSGDNVSSLTNDAGYLTSSTGVTSVNGQTGAVVVNEALEPLVGDTDELSPADVRTALIEGRSVRILNVNWFEDVQLALIFTNFNVATDIPFQGAVLNVVISQTIVRMGTTCYLWTLLGDVARGTWESQPAIIALRSEIPSDLSDLNNDMGFINAAQAASAAPVQSVNGQTGAVSLTIPTVPTTVSSFTNDAGYVNASGAASAAPVQSVNGQTGAVSLSIPTVPTNVSSFTNDAGYLTLADLPIYNGGVQ